VPWARASSNGHSTSRGKKSHRENDYDRIAPGKRGEHFEKHVPFFSNNPVRKQLFELVDEQNEPSDRKFVTRSGETQ
jgi:hypothetical protein